MNKSQRRKKNDESSAIFKNKSENYEIYCTDFMSFCFFVIPTINIFEFLLHL